MFNQNRLFRVFKLINLLKSAPPKSIKRLSDSMEISERSTYRYMELLTEVGFVIHKDNSNRYFIESDKVDSFTKEESDIINQLLSSISKSNPLVKSIRTKLNSLNELNIISNSIVQSHSSKIIGLIKESIENRLQIILVKYQSASTESVTDRHVEPIGFTNNYESLMAYEIETKINKSFKIERIGDVIITNHPIIHEGEHETLVQDIFGFNDTGESYPIKLQMSMRAMLWMKDDYPLSVDFMKEDLKGQWIFETIVFSMDPVNRLLRSMPKDIISINS